MDTMETLVEQFDLDFEEAHRSMSQLSCVTCKGFITNVSGLTVESTGPAAGVGQLCGIEMSNDREVLAEVIGFRNGRLILLPLENIDGISPGNIVNAKSSQITISLDNSILGRVIDGIGRPIDGKGPLKTSVLKSIENKGPEPLTRDKITKPLPLGIRSIDGLLTCGKGQRIGIFAGSGVGKSVLLGDIAVGSDAQVNVVVLVGERGREVREFLEENLGPEGLAKSVVVVATSDSNAIQRVKAGSVGATIAEYFRDQGKDVLFMMDSLTRFAQAQREIGLASGEPPASKGYCPSVFAMMPKLIERLGCSDKGTITGILTVLAEGDDMNDPVADSARSLLDGHIVLSRKLAARGHFPAIEILGSVSRLFTTVTSREHQAAARVIREIYSTYSDAEDLINIGALAKGANKKIDGSIALIEMVRDILIQGVREKTDYDDTVTSLLGIAEQWNELVGNQI